MAPKIAQPSSAGARIAGLRASNASGPHDPRPRRKRSRGDRRRAAINDSRS